MSATTCPVFRPSLEHFRNFSKYIDEVIDEKIGDHGICKVIPPKGWYKKPKAEEMEELWDEQNLIIPPIKQCISGLRGVYQLGLMDTKRLTVKEFQTMAEKIQPENFDELSYEERERLFWRSMGPLAPPPLYGADMSGSLFRDEASGWNLNMLDNMIKLLPSNLPGITTAMLYFGMWRAMFAWHTEDMNLYSINYLHAGRPKSWYSIPPKAVNRFESMCQGLHPQGFQGCTQYMRHKTSMYSPKVLKESGIPYHMVVQQPGEFIITFPASYHAGFNHGFNIAEATNFTTEKWVAKGREAKVCRCQPYSVHINMDHFVMKLEAKREADQRKLEAMNSEKEKKRACKKQQYTGWLEWQRKEEEIAREEEAKYQEERMRLQKERRLARERERRRIGREEHTTVLGEKRKLDDVSEEDTSVEDRLDDEEWEFRCYCGVKCSSQDPVETWPKGAMFQCTGCNIWCHTQCIYSREKAPMLAFCNTCFNLLKFISEGSLPLRTGKGVKIKSRVAVCRGPRGLEEGTVTMIGEGLARVQFKSKSGYNKQVIEEWISLDSDRFLSLPQILKALGMIKERASQIRAQIAASEARKKFKAVQRTVPLRGIPLPNAEAAVAHARFMKDLYRSKKAFRNLFNTRAAHHEPDESVPKGGSSDIYRLYHHHAPNAASIFADDCWTSDEEDGTGGREGLYYQGASTEDKKSAWVAASVAAAYADDTRPEGEEGGGISADSAAPQQQQYYQQAMNTMMQLQREAWEKHRKLVESLGLSIQTNPAIMMSGGMGYPPAGPWTGGGGQGPTTASVATSTAGMSGQQQMVAYSSSSHYRPYAAIGATGGAAYPYYYLYYPGMTIPSLQYPYPFYTRPPPTTQQQPSPPDVNQNDDDNRLSQSSKKLGKAKAFLKEKVEEIADGWRDKLELPDDEIEGDILRMKEQA